jgi:hypothetical protein
MLKKHKTYGKLGSTMNSYEIRVQGRLDQRWSDWFDGLIITYDAEENTVLRGPLVDEAALHGVLIKVRDLALPLLAVNRVEAEGLEQERQNAGETRLRDKHLR